MMMKKSQSSTFHESKSRKLWRSITSKDKSLPLPKYSVPNVSAPSSPVTPEFVNSIPRSRSSMLILEQPTTRNNNHNHNRRSLLNKYKSTVDFSTFRIDEETTDPEELEFYNQICKRESSKHYSFLPESEIGECDEEVQKTTINEKLFDSALEDYKLFTGSPLNSPDSSTFSDSSSIIPEEDKIVSIPSFILSGEALDSKESIMTISNSLWVGSTITDLEFEQDMILDAFGGVDVSELFSERLTDKISLGPNASKTHRASGCVNRTSLFFG